MVYAAAWAGCAPAAACEPTLHAEETVSRGDGDSGAAARTAVPGRTDPIPHGHTAGRGEACLVLGSSKPVVKS